MRGACIGIALALAAGCAAPAFDPETVRARRAAAPPPSVAHAEGTFEGEGGLRLFEQSWRPAGVTPSAALVIVHGLKDHSSRYAALAERLARDGIAVHAYDHRGHGCSEGDRVRVDAFDEYVADLGRFIERVEAREGRERPLFIFGHSMGGAIVMLHALDRPPPPALRGLILSAPALKPGADISAALIRVTKILAALFPSLAVMDLPNELFSRDPAEVEAMSADPLIYQGNGPARTAAELLGALERIEARLADLRAPVLILHGTADRITDPEGSRALAARAASPRKTLRLYEGFYHDLLHEPPEARARVVIDIRAWLTSRAAPAPPR